MTYTMFMAASGKVSGRRARQTTGAREAVGRYRAKMRQQGMRLVQFWAPDVRARGFAEECRRQSILVSRRKGDEKQILDEIEAFSAELDLGPAPDFVMPSRGRRK